MSQPRSPQPPPRAAGLGTAPTSRVAAAVPSQPVPWVPLCGAALAAAALASYWAFQVLQVHFQCR